MHIFTCMRFHSRAALTQTLYIIHLANSGSLWAKKRKNKQWRDEKILAGVQKTRGHTLLLTIKQENNHISTLDA